MERNLSHVSWVVAMDFIEMNSSFACLSSALIDAKSALLYMWTCLGLGLLNL